MRTRCLRYASVLGGAALFLSLGSMSECVAQVRGPQDQSEVIEIPPEEFEKHVKRFSLSEMSPEEAMALMGVMSKATQGSSGQLPQMGPTPGGGGGFSNPSVFPQIPPAVAGNREALGRWMVFQAELLYKLSETYAQYAQELLKPAKAGQPGKQAPTGAKQDPTKKK